LQALWQSFGLGALACVALAMCLQLGKDYVCFKKEQYIVLY
jgi:hypothetical protein